MKNKFSIVVAILSISLTMTLSKAQASRHVLFFVPPASNDVQQAFIRIVNPNESAISVSIDAIDDSGEWSLTETQYLTLNANAALQLNSSDIESGNSAKGLLKGFGVGEGNWRLILNSDNDIDVMSYIRTPDGFVNDMHDVVGGKPFQTYHHVPIFNPASNPNQQSKLRISNDDSVLNTITIYGYDGSGKIAGSVVVNLNPLEVIELTSSDLENGNENKGLSGSLGDGTGKWRLELFSTKISTMMNLLDLPGGYISNLSGMSDNGSTEQVVTPETTSYESKVRDTFGGWDGDTIVELDNGQIWKQQEYYYEYIYAYRPTVVVYQSFGVWKMWVEGTDKPIRVTKIN